MSEQDAAPAESKRLVKRGNKKHSEPLSALFTKVFETVTEYVREIQDAIISHSPTMLSNSRLTAIDYYIAFQSAVRAADLNKGSQNKLKKLLRGDTIGSGAKNILSVRLAPVLLSRQYALYPRSRFFVAGKAWSDAKKRLSVPSSKSKAQTQTPAEVIDNAARYFNADGKPQTLAEVRSESELRIAEARAADAEAARVAAEAARLAEEEAEMLSNEFFFADDSFARQDAALSLEEISELS